jgi:peptidoglycan/xylan/chitin deacetylase (PgdA/CDA1 family)
MMFDRNAIILAFHQTSKKFFPGINNIKPDKLLAIISLIEGFGFNLYDIPGKQKQDQADRPEVVITFDDGYEDNFDILMRLRAKGILPLVFIPTDFIGRENKWDYPSRWFPARHLNRNQIKVLANDGIIIGSHGASHRCLTGIEDDQLRDELSRSRMILEDITGKEVKFLSYPFGRTNNRVDTIARLCGYTKAFGLAGISPADFVAPRIPIYSNDNYYSIKARLLFIHSRLELLKMNIINRLAGGTIIVSTRLK